MSQAEAIQDAYLCLWWAVMEPFHDIDFLLWEDELMR